MIPFLSTRRFPVPLDNEAHRKGDLIERMKGRLTSWRRIGTRCDCIANNATEESRLRPGQEIETGWLPRDCRALDAA